MKTLNIALFGCGTVGSGVYSLLSEVAQKITWRTGAALRVAKVCVRDLQKERPVQIPPELLTTDGTALLDDPAINVVVEVIGGEAQALGIITRALVNGKQVVTANKLVVAKYLPLLRRLEELHGGRLLYGASVCGSVPILKLIDETLPFDHVNKVRGILNGSTNFILSRLADGVSRTDALAIAEREGFLEADPTADISGADAAQKLSILIYHAFGVHLSPDAIPTTGIEYITERDLEHAHAGGSTIKLVAEAWREHGIVKASVAPRLLPLGDPLAAVRDEVNIVEVTCEGVGVQHFTGRGAGSIPTANAVVTDLLDIVKDRRYRVHQPSAPPLIHPLLNRVAA